jgi:CheY-like chemotaxis protein
MKRVLLVEDDPDQLMLRKMLVERAGYAVTAAESPAKAIDALRLVPDAAVLDLSLPDMESGLGLISRLHTDAPQLPLAVLTGWRGALSGRPEAAFVREILDKPCPPPKLIAAIARLLACLLLLITPGLAKEFAFESHGRGEMVAELDLRAPGSDFAFANRAAAVAVLRVNGGEAQHVVVLGERRDRYSVFLGALPAGKYTLRVDRDEKHSAPDSPLEIRSAKFREDDSDMLAHAPILFARADTIGSFSDIPLIVYAESDPRQYTVIFSHEDGGTNTVGLMARWGRTTDIEHIYRFDGERWLIQTRDHKDVPYDGPYEGKHPLLIPVTKNNMVEPGTGELRFQIVPQSVDLRGHSREVVMDRAPWTYAVAAKELIREGRMADIGDPRNYVYIEARIKNHDSRIAFRVRLVTEREWRTSHRGDRRLAIERDGWVRSTIQLPEGTGARQIAEFGVECLPEKEDVEPRCELLSTNPAFFLTPDYVPGRTFRLPVAVSPNRNP